MKAEHSTYARFQPGDMPLTVLNPPCDTEMAAQKTRCQSHEGPLLFNLSLTEAEGLCDLTQRAQALTFMSLDASDERVRALIRSVNVPETGALGAALKQHLLPPLPPPSRRPRKRGQRPIPKATQQALRGNLFEALADELALVDRSRVSINEEMLMRDQTDTGDKHAK